MPAELRCAIDDTLSIEFENTTANDIAVGVLDLYEEVVGFNLQPIQKTGQTFDRDFPNGKFGVIVYDAEYALLPKQTGGATNCIPGEDLFYDDATNDVTPTSATGLFKCGTCQEAASTADDTVLARLSGANVVAVP